MLWWLISTIIGVWLVDETCQLFLSWSPLASLHKAVERRRQRSALSPSERERLRELEDRELQRQIDDLPKKGGDDV